MRLSVLYLYIHLITRIEDNPLEGEVVLQGPTWTLRCWSPARLGKMCLCIIGSLWTGDHRFVSRFPSCSYMETSSLGRKLLSSSESAPCELYCSTVILSSYLTRSNLSYNHLFLVLNPLPDIRTLELILTALLKALSSIICVRYLAARGGE